MIDAISIVLVMKSVGGSGYDNHNEIKSLWYIIKKTCEQGVLLIIII